MTIQLSDEQIANLVSESKPLPDNYKSLMRTRPKKGHRERDLNIKGTHGNDFRIILRQSEYNALDFSVILAYCPPQTNILFLLRRYNGRSHEHTNSIEEETFYNFHVHHATERYQELGAKEASYAVPTTEYASLEEAIQCLFGECGFIVPPDINSAQGKLL